MSRAPNYTSVEKEMLLSIVEKHKDIIENKRGDASSLFEKNNTWQEIAKTFNSMSPMLVPRTVESLKKYYEHLKENIRKKMAEHRKETYKTGGGPPKNPKTDDMDDLLLSIVNKKSVYGINSQFYCDSVTPPEEVIEYENAEQEVGKNNENVVEIIFQDDIEYQNGSDVNMGASCSGEQKPGTTYPKKDIIKNQSDSEDSTNVIVPPKKGWTYVQRNQLKVFPGIAFFYFNLLFYLHVLRNINIFRISLKIKVTQKIQQMLLCPQKRMKSKVTN